jgi:hypothetical protein
LRTLIGDSARHSITSPAGGECLRNFRICRHSRCGDSPGKLALRLGRGLRDLLRRLFQLSKRLSRLFRDGNACEERQWRRHDGRQASVENDRLRPSMCRMDADDRLVHPRFLHERLRGSVRPISVCHEQHRKKQASDKKEVANERHLMINRAIPKERPKSLVASVARRQAASRNSVPCTSRSLARRQGGDPFSLTPEPQIAETPGNNWRRFGVFEVRAR